MVCNLVDNPGGTNEEEMPGQVRRVRHDNLHRLLAPSLLVFDFASRSSMVRDNNNRRASVNDDSQQRKYNVLDITFLLLL